MCYDESRGAEQNIHSVTTTYCKISIFCEEGRILSRGIRMAGSMLMHNICLLIDDCGPLCVDMRFMAGGRAER